MTRSLDLAVTAWGALGRGILTGKYNQDASTEGRAKLWGAIAEKNLAVADVVIKVAEEVGYTPSQVALNWVRQQPGVMIPIIGAKTAAQLQDNLGCLEFRLTEPQLVRLSEVSRIELGFPHDFLASDSVRDLVFGGRSHR
jgi:aryl-alcohol dehydrogenase-like predicted oxidoreductase